jgi:quinolinate synthase
MAETLAVRLGELKRLRRAVILAHNYQRPEVQDAADFVGDSLELSRQAARADAEIVLFCGVHFMAETAAVLCPGRAILVPDLNAGCPMANMITPRELRQLKQSHPGAAVVAYVNTTAAVKAESDICCTSANAVQVLRSVAASSGARSPADGAREIIFIPDRYLADYASRMAGVSVIPWPGYCPTHVRILPEHIRARKAEHPQAKVVVHPECRREVIELADQAASTSGMARYCLQSDAREFIVGTEPGLLHRLRKENPGKQFYPATELADCPNMKLNTLEKMVWALEDRLPEVLVPADVAERARRAIERMLAIA